MNGPIDFTPDAHLGVAARAFLDDLDQRFRPRLLELLGARERQQAYYDAGNLPDFPHETAVLREEEWTVAPPPTALLDRRVEITGPADPKMIINGLNSGASVFMADFEDSLAPTWSAVLAGHVALSEAVRGTLTFEANGKHYALNAERAALFVRPRGLHLVEAHYPVDGHAIPASLFDFGLHVFHNGVAATERGTGPWFYLPKLQSHHEAAWWGDLFAHAEVVLGLPHGTIRATVLIETLPAAFEMDEILWALRHWSVGLNCGRWDYIFSTIKTLGSHPDRVLPDRASVTMDRAFLDAYSRRLVEICHRRGCHAMGGMAAQIPGKSHEENVATFRKIREDKLAEVRKGHDGTWVAHPALVPVAREVFDAEMPGPNQILRRTGTMPGRDELLTLHDGQRTEAGMRQNLRVGVQYLEAWLRGVGCVPLYGLMEDAATAEISRAQLWQWQRWGLALADGSVVTADRLRAAMDEELAVVRDELGDRFDPAPFSRAAALFLDLCTGERFADFLTVPAYALLTQESTS